MTKLALYVPLEARPDRETRQPSSFGHFFPSLKRSRAQLLGMRCGLITTPSHFLPLSRTKLRGTPT